ncbi:MAG: triosephosphate isomerase [Candidatus Methanomethylophilaceae archaeon]|nr:triosephosphate isomerase [Candidatus Methanomethylophilaceae archaeon]
MNFKAYQEVNGPGALELAKICEKVSEESGLKVGICPPMVDLGHIARNVNIPVFAQNVDPRAPGSATGWVTPAMVKGCGATGTLINHTEHKIRLNEISECNDLAKASDLITVICSDNDKIAAQVAQFRPDFIAVEPPDLIGGDLSVTKANPAIIENTVDAVRSVNHAVMILCGAGIKTGADVRAALDLGADGVLLASGVVRSKDPEAAVRDLVGKI